MEHQWKDTERGKLKYKEKNLPQCFTILLTTNQSNSPWTERGILRLFYFNV